MGGGGDSTTKTGIAKEYQPLAREYASRASELSNEQFTPYTGQRFAETTGDQQAAYDLLRQQTQGGTNPYLDAMVNKAQANTIGNYNNVIRPQQDALAARSGSFGNSGVQSTIERDQLALGNQLGDIATGLYGGAYENDANRRANATTNLLTAGNQQQAQAQQGLDFNFQQFQDMINQPYKNLQTLGAPLSGNMLGTISKTSTSGK